ncbi:MAG: HNH endonuclease [Burkholderiaceae bacterium]
MVASSVVDHIVPHRGDLLLFWRRSNWQALCKPCHDRTKQTIERGGIESGCDLNGIPTSPRHPWRAQGGGIKSPGDG